MLLLGIDIWEPPNEYFFVMVKNGITSSYYNQAQTYFKFNHMRDTYYLNINKNS